MRRSGASLFLGYWSTRIAPSLGAMTVERPLISSDYRLHQRAAAHPLFNASDDSGGERDDGHDDTHGHNAAASLYW